MEDDHLRQTDEDGDDPDDDQDRDDSASLVHKG